ncbi:MAG TPA: hypothetical protein VF796_23710 [Humisphaera sp.]
MKTRIAATFALGAALFAVGCQESSPAKPADSMKPAAAAAAKPKYFEIAGPENKTYVFGSVDAMMAYQQSGKLPAMATHYLKGKTVPPGTARRSSPVGNPATAMAGR